MNCQYTELACGKVRDGGTKVIKQQKKERLLPPLTMCTVHTNPSATDTQGCGCTGWR
jgi:hypothetical protein